MITLNELDKTKIYILGVSGGPDSMALFHMCLQQGLKIVAAHMNYQMRTSAYRDMKIVEDYACANAVPYELRLQNKECKGNFEAFAREQRYIFYKELVWRYQAQAVLLAHHMDDHIETYILQKERGSEGITWGISDQTTIMGCEIIRPLLHLTKENIMNYCHVYHIPYGIDETNLGNAYARNRVRHQIVERMNIHEKSQFCDKIAKENKQKEKTAHYWEQYFLSWHETLDELLELPSTQLETAIFYFLYIQIQHAVSKHECAEIAAHIRKRQRGWSRVIVHEYELYEEYGKICIDILKEVFFKYQYDQFIQVSTPYFIISQKGTTTEALTLTTKDFPITIRSPQKGDAITLRFGRKKINRWFIDRKIPKKQRKRWPIVTNCQGNIILVPKLGCDIEHFSNNPTLFVLK